MADTTTPTTPPAQDLQINLADAPKAEEIVIPENTKPELDLSLDLNLPEVPKNDDRLKTEDQKNAAPVETAAIQVEPVIEKTPAPTLEPIPELIKEIPVIENKVVEQKNEVPAEIIEQPSTVVETEAVTVAAPAELKEDMKMINELEATASVGGLAAEATVAAQPAPIETPKTFDLDAMLGSPTPTPTIQMAPQAMPPMPAAAPTPVQMPAFTIPTTTTQVPVQAVPQVKIPKKNASVKALMFVVLFVALGFTTFFILKTMYPIEFNNMFGGGQTQMHASDATTGTEEMTGTDLSGAEELTGTDLSGAVAIDQGSGEIPATDSGTHESAITDSGFGELNDLTTTATTPAMTDIDRLTDYVTQGNNFLAQGKTMGNNTVIKYGLYISKKASTFLDNIANGQEINNLSGYFAQFDQYIAELKILVGETPNPTTTATTPDETVSTASATGDGLQDMTTTDTTTPAPTPDAGVTSE